MQATQKHIPSVTIGIAAHNEERSIRRVIRSLLRQRGGSYHLESIIVLCDGCTDSTAARVQSVADFDKRVILINDGLRTGKIGRLNWLCANVTSDILLIFDADIEVRDMYVLEKYAKGFMKTGAQLVSGLHLPQKPRNFMESIFVTWDMIWMQIRTTASNIHTVHNIAGCNFGMTKEMYKDLRIPPELIAEDEYVFFESQRRGFTYQFLPDIHIHFQLPGTLSDYLRQSTRFIATKHGMELYFKEGVADAYILSGKQKLAGIWKVMKKRPFRTICALFLQVLVRIYSHMRTIKMQNGVWETIKSTK